MSSEQFNPQSFEQPLQRTGTSFEHNDQIDLHSSDLTSLEVQLARADVAAATAASPAQTLEKQVESHLEHVPLKQHEVIALLGRRVVFDLRKKYQDDNLDLENDEPARYVFSPQTDEPAQYMTNRQASIVEEAEAIIAPMKDDTTENTTKDQFDLTA